MSEKWSTEQQFASETDAKRDSFTSNEIADYWRSDASKAWTCIPGRVCGGAQFMRDARAEIERLHADQVHWHDEALRLSAVALAERAERDRLRAAVEKMGRAGDCLAHQLTFKDNGGLLSIWWEARGGHEACTACNETESE